MIRFIRDLRLIPIAVIASACLLVLKTTDFVLDRGGPAASDATPSPDSDTKVIHATPGTPRPGNPQRSWAQQMFNFPDAKDTAAAPRDAAPLPVIARIATDNANADIVTGSVAGNTDEKSEVKAKAKSDAIAAPNKDGQNAPLPNGTVITTNGPPTSSAAERAILERLQERRQELDKRARELDIREGLIAGAEKRIEARLAEIKEGQAQLTTAAEKKDEAEAARFKSLVTMYENMKPRDAAKIFDRLEIGVLMEVASQINPRRMADILAQMSAEAAERLTVELANRAKSGAKGSGGELPKIEGQPTTP
jgi:flagellar motility protein MotE (MotC chaperone)